MSVSGGILFLFVLRFNYIAKLIIINNYIIIIINIVFIYTHVNVIYIKLNINIYNNACLINI